jgi:hypothetical protein
MRMTDVKISEHFKAQFRAKGFTAAQVKDAVENPYKVTDVRRYPGQKRYCGRLGLAVVVRDNILVTCYLDGIVTALREDQKTDPAAHSSHRLRQG